ncbi:MAG TPA: hypothetical protein VG477_01000 [Thermoanaerobaculia bacterium]|nr:hypothetical protein [Thermoanaerobaculia bacterium]
MKKIRLFALVGALGFVALTGAQAAGTVPIEPLCMCACPDGTIICVSANNGDCRAPCQQAMKSCPSGS